MRLKLKQLLCFHKWEYLNKPNENGEADVRCTKCGKEEYKKVDSSKTVPRNYCWCPNCTNDLVRNSFVNEAENGIVTYICTACGRRTRWHFGIAPVAILLEEESECN